MARRSEEREAALRTKKASCEEEGRQSMDHDRLVRPEGLEGAAKLLNRSGVISDCQLMTNAAFPP